MHRDRRGEQDRAVDPGDSYRQPFAWRPAVGGDNADEEIGREESSEEHDLGDDEEQDAEHLGIYA